MLSRAATLNSTSHNSNLITINYVLTLPLWQFYSVYIKYLFTIYLDNSKFIVSLNKIKFPLASPPEITAVFYTLTGIIKQSLIIPLHWLCWYCCNCNVWFCSYRSHAWVWIQHTRTTVISSCLQQKLPAEFQQSRPECANTHLPRQRNICHLRYYWSIVSCPDIFQTEFGCHQWYVITVICLITQLWFLVVQDIIINTGLYILL